MAWVNLALPGKCLDVENGWAIEQMPMQIWDCNLNTGNQAWLGYF